jgi:large subunit ribosomal protein L7/L12
MRRVDSAAVDYDPRAHEKVTALAARVAELERRVAALDGGSAGDSAGGWGFPDAPEDAANEEILSLLREGKKIEAIKHYREATGAGLKEAKDAVERIEAGG